MLRNVFKSISIGVFASLLSWATCAQAANTKANPCFSASDWVGKYPDDPSAVHGRFLSLPCVQRSMRVLLPQSEYQTLRLQLNVDSPIEMMGRFLIVARCKAHNCPSHHAMIIINSETAEIIVGVYHRGSASSRTTWYSTYTDPLQLPPEVLEYFLQRHAPK